MPTFRISTLATCALLATALAGCNRPESGPPPAAATTIPANALPSPTPQTENANVQVAIFGAGCFWGVEAAFRQVKGVKSTSVGYAGGRTTNPTYKDVCYEDTGHTEVVRVEFDPAKVSYDRLLEVFWECHDPTQVNRQGPDVGDQYRTVIFTTTDAQRAAAERSKAALAASGKHKKPIATLIEPAPAYYLAEDYHQQYLEKRGLSSCHIKE
jgi:peptide-methionine (S)-S-oxide reductase